MRLVPIDFEAESWWEGLAAFGFDPDQPAVVVSTGVTMYLTKEANAATLRQVAALAPGSTLATTFILPLELLDPADRPVVEETLGRARAAGTPFISLYSPAEMLALASDAGFRKARARVERPIWPSGTSPRGLMAFGYQAERTYWSPLPSAVARHESGQRCSSVELRGKLRCPTPRGA